MGGRPPRGCISVMSPWCTQCHATEQQAHGERDMHDRGPKQSTHSFFLKCRWWGLDEVRYDDRLMRPVWVESPPICTPCLG